MGGMARCDLKTMVMLALLLVQQAVRAAMHIRFAGIFSDHAVLQRDVAAPVWGWGEPGEQVTVGFAGQTKTATADDNGKWQVMLDPMPASDEGREMVVQSGSENRKAKISDVLVGEVWLWQAADPQSANLFSAIGYLFGEIIQRETGVPVGIINASRGGTWIENWLTRELVETLPNCKYCIDGYHKGKADGACGKDQGQ